MGVLTSWVYPIQGVIYLLTTPQLLQLVLRFLGIVTAASLMCTIVCFWLLWELHMEVIGQLLGVHLLAKLVVTFVLLVEAAIPIYIIFDHRLEKLGRQLFDATLLLKLGAVVQPGTSHSTALAALQQPHQVQQSDLQLRQPSVTPVHPQEHQALTRMVTMRRQQDAAAQQGRSAASMALNLVLQLLFNPSPDESKLVRKARDLATVGFTALVPGAALLLPLFLYRDSTVEVVDLMSRYWEAKGITDGYAQHLLAQHHMAELRGFGLVATALSYIPVLNWALALSNHVAAALYAAHLEKKGARLVTGW